MTALQIDGAAGEHISREADRRKRVLRVLEAAEYTGLSPSTLAKRRLYGLPPKFVSLGGRAIGYLREDLDGWLKDCRRSSTSQTEPEPETT